MPDQDKCKKCSRVFEETDIFVYCTKRECPMKSGEFTMDILKGKETGEDNE